MVIILKLAAKNDIIRSHISEFYYTYDIMIQYSILKLVLNLSLSVIKLISSPDLGKC
jgi:hypothetical protein